MKKMRVTLEIDVDDLSPEKRAEYAKDMETIPDELPALKDTSAREAANALENFGGDMNEELFAGSDTYVQFIDVRVMSAELIA